MKIQFFGRLLDAAGEAERVVDVPPEVTDAESLRIWLGVDNPALLKSLRHPSVRLIVNDALVHGNPALRREDEVAFFPPVSGG